MKDLLSYQVQKKKKKRSTHCCGYDYEGLDYATLQLNYNKNKTEAPTIVG